MSTNEADLDHLDIAALDGNVEFLEEVYRVNREDLSSYFLRKLSNGNFIHSAVKMNNYVLLSKAMEILPPKMVVELLCQSDEVEGSNPLHYAAKEGNIFTVKLLVNAYISSSSSLCYKGTPPWLMKNNDGSIPSHICFMTTTNNSHECAARYLVSRDQHLLKSLGEQKYPVSPDQSTTMSVDNTGASILFYAMLDYYDPKIIKSNVSFL